MKKITLITCLLLLCALGLYFIPQKAVESDKPVIYIGATLPLTGDMSFLGQAAKSALIKALRDEKENRDLKYEYELVFEDDQMDIKKALLNAQRMKSLNNIQGIFSIFLISEFLTNWAETNKVIQMGCSWGYGSAKGLYNFNHCTFHQEQTELFIKELKKHGFSKIGIFRYITPVHEEIAHYVRRRLGEDHIETLFDISVLPGERDLRLSIQKMQESDVDIILVLLNPPVIQIFGRQAKELGLSKPMTSFESFLFAPDYFEGAWFVADAVGSAAFQTEFENETGLKPQTCTANFYDELRLLIRAFETAAPSDGKPPETAAVATEILKTKDFKGVVGNVWIDAEGNMHSSPALVQIKSGKIAPLSD
ncbi:MAG: ABC transporter substrate-binding protein [Lactobacillales bacterium]|jgi:ABC-type branched-subunit amino acid transport system substrate-binding protein|nr:ABC transporter substrate-binding protein [Lactobacillales bacterium]